MQQPLLINLDSVDQCFKIGLMIEPKKLLIHDSLVESTVELVMSYIDN